MSSLLGATIRAEAAPPPATWPREEALWTHTTLQAGAPAEVWLAASRDTAIAIGGAVLGVAGREASGPESHDAYPQFAGQVLAALAREISGRLGREVVSGPTRMAAGPPASGSLTLAQARFALSSGEALLTASVPAALLEFPGEGPGRGPTMELLFDVELPVSISFGRAQLALKDVLKLTSGSIVELNRSVTEPVEVIVNNCVVARGEVVVVDGNYGVRIQKIISRQERLRTLR